MTSEQMLKNLEVPSKRVDVVLDTDAYNEIDDQFAIAYLLRSGEKLKTKAIYAAPFFNEKSTGPEDGMEKSYLEILKLLDLADEKVDVFKGSRSFLTDESTFIDSPAARDLVCRAQNYSAENPLYVVALGAITNVASALLMSPGIAENIVIVWLGGHALHYHDTKEFNMWHDMSAARVVMKSSVPFVQLPCMGVVSEFRISKPELEKWFCGKNNLSDYLASNAISDMSWCKDGIWTRVIWDLTAVAWLLNDNNRFMQSRIINTRLPLYDGTYCEKPEEKIMRYVYSIERDALMRDLIEKVAK